MTLTAKWGPRSGCRGCRDTTRNPCDALFGAALLALGMACLSVPGPSSASDSERLVVFDLAPERFDREQAAGLSERLRRELGSMGHVELIARADLYAYMAGKGLELGGCDPACRDAVAAALGAGWIVAGGIEPVGDEVRIEAMLYDTGKRRVRERVERRVSADPQRLQDREMPRLARDLAPPRRGGGGFPWVLLLLGAGGGGAWLALQDEGKDGGAGGGGPGGGGDGGGGRPGDEFGAAEITGIFAD